MTAAVPGRMPGFSHVRPERAARSAAPDATKPPGQGGFVSEERRSAVGRAGRQSDHTLGLERALGMTGRTQLCSSRISVPVPRRESR